MSIVKQFYDMNTSCLDEAGLEISHAFLLGPDDAITVVALAVPPEQGYQAIISLIVENKIKEAIFAFDRFARSGQGTRYDSLLAGHYYRRSSEKLTPGDFTPFVIEYQTEPRIVDPICWENEFWSLALRRELTANVLAMVGIDVEGLPMMQ